jgi:2-phospho-L-lactate guanylyltransferase
MPAIVVPFRGEDGKQRVDLPDERRSALALAMLADVLGACSGLGDIVVVTSNREAGELARESGARLADDPGGGQGAAVASALAGLSGTVLVVNADLPCAAPEDIRLLDAATPDEGLVFVPASDGTTNALALSSPSLFAPLYGADSAERFRRHAEALGIEAVEAAIANLADDVDSLEDLERLHGRLGPHTRAVFER